MREHSGADGGKNNNRNPTLRDAERGKGKTGEATTAETPGKKEADRLTKARP
jgi:hypothetical protein